MVDYLLGLAVFFSYWLISAFVTLCLVLMCFKIDQVLHERKVKRWYINWEAEKQKEREERESEK